MSAPSVVQVKVAPPFPGSLNAGCSTWFEIPGTNIPGPQLSVPFAVHDVVSVRPDGQPRLKEIIIMTDFICFSKAGKAVSESGRPGEAALSHGGLCFA